MELILIANKTIIVQTFLECLECSCIYFIQQINRRLTFLISILNLILSERKAHLNTMTFFIWIEVVQTFRESMIQFAILRY